MLIFLVYLPCHQNKIHTMNIKIHTTVLDTNTFASFTGTCEVPTSTYKTEIMINNAKAMAEMMPDCVVTVVCSNGDAAKFPVEEKPLSELTNAEAEEMAKEMVGDGGSPNRYFVTATPYCYTNPDDTEMSPMVDNPSRHLTVTRAFDSLEAATEYYEDVSLSVPMSIGNVMIEDRQTGMIHEKFLRAEIKYVKVEDYF